MDVLMISKTDNYKELTLSSIKGNSTLRIPSDFEVKDFLDNNGFNILERFENNSHIFHILDKYDPHLFVVINKLSEPEQTEEGEN